MSVRYQRGHLRCVKRKNGSSCWEFLWREIGPAGKPKRRTMMIGTLEQFPTAQLAANAVNGLRVSINVERIRQRQAVLMSDLIDHYILTDCPSKSARIQKRIGWHTFRHTYSTLLVSNGENVKVIQELMRHASSRSTLEIYSQARNGDKRAAQQRVMQMIFPEDLNANEWVTEHEPVQADGFEWIN